MIHRSKRRKNLISPDDSKIINMVSLQDSLIMMLGNYYNKTHLNTLDVHKEMFPDKEHDEVSCECGKSHFPIELILLDYFDIRENRLAGIHDKALHAGPAFMGKFTLDQATIFYRRHIIGSRPELR